jgi:ATP-dependent Lon protease
MEEPAALRVATERLRPRCAPADCGFETTAEVEPIAGVIGQDLAVDALRFGLATDAPGHNIFVRGLVGTGRMSLIRHLLEDIQPFCPLSQDVCYVHDFDHPEQPRLITLPRGHGRRFGRAVEDLIDFVQNDLAAALVSDRARERIQALEAELRSELSAIGEPFDEELRKNHLTLVSVQVGRVAHPAIFPLLDDKPVPPEQFEEMRRSGKLSAEDARAIRDKIQRFSEQLAEINRRVFEAQTRHRERVRDANAVELRAALETHTRAIAERFRDELVRSFLAHVTRDLIHRFAEGQTADGDFSLLYRVNVLAGHEETDGGMGTPILVETRPSVTNLMGTIEREWPREGQRTPDHLLIRAGSLLRANGGFLILEARDLLAEPGAWRALVRTLRGGRLQIAPPEGVIFGTHVAVKPEPIQVHVKVVLVGDAELFYALDALDPDFPYLFKVLADFDAEIPRDRAGIGAYAGVLARIVRERGLLPFGADAVAALVEHGARIAGRQDRLSARFGRLSDIAHEASFLARRAARDRTTAEDVDEAIRRGRARADLPARKFRERITDGTIRIQTRDRVVGQINGLAVVAAGPLVFGFPSRISATIGAGTDGTISIEQQARLSGAIHTKGFQILGGLLRHLLKVDHPLAFRASLAFEQSYGGIDGDSASGAETVCLLSALTGLPVRQDLAMTGAIDQLGHLQPIGAATEKIEGFFDVCAAAGLTGTQGVIVPAANVHDLMLRKDVVAACAEGRFSVFAVATIQQALELFLDTPAGEADARGRYPPGSVLGIAVRRAGEFWRMISRRPPDLDETDGGGPDEAETS